MSRKESESMKEVKELDRDRANSVKQAASRWVCSSDG